MSTRHLIVDGETFEVAQRGDGTDTWDFSWVSGPHDGYGFSAFAPAAFTAEGDSPAAHAVRDEVWMTAQIRSFLAQVNPATGYIGY